MQMFPDFLARPVRCTEAKSGELVTGIPRAVLYISGSFNNGRHCRAVLVYSLWGGH